MSTAGFYKKRNAAGQMTTRPVISSLVTPFREPDLEIFRTTVRKAEGQKVYSEGEVLNEIEEYNDEYGDPEHGPAPASLADVSFELSAPADLQESVEENVAKISPQLNHIIERLISKGLVTRVSGGFVVTEQGRSYVANRPVLSRRGFELATRIHQEKFLHVNQFDPSDFVTLDALEARHFITIDRKKEGLPVMLTAKGEEELKKANKTLLERPTKSELATTVGVGLG